MTVTAPSGESLSATTTLAWTYAGDPDADSGGAQVRYHVKVFTIAQYGAAGFDPATSTPAYDFGEVMSNMTTISLGPLANGGYKAYVRAAQNVNGSPQWSLYDDGPTFTINTDQPAVASITAVNADNGVRVTVVRDLAHIDWTHVDVQRSVGDTAHWRTIRGGLQVVAPTTRSSSTTGRCPKASPCGTASRHHHGRIGNVVAGRMGDNVDVDHLGYRRLRRVAARTGEPGRRADGGGDRRRGGADDAASHRAARRDRSGVSGVDLGHAGAAGRRVGGGDAQRPSRTGSQPPAADGAGVALSRTAVLGPRASLDRHHRSQRVARLADPAAAWSEFRKWEITYAEVSEPPVLSGGTAAPAPLALLTTSSAPMVLSDRTGSSVPAPAGRTTSSRSRSSMGQQSDRHHTRTQGPTSPT